MNKTIKYRRLNREERKLIVELWTSGQAKMPELAQAYDVCTKTIRNTLSTAGVWPGVDDYTRKPDSYRDDSIQKELLAASDAVRSDVEYNRLTPQGRKKTFPELVEFAVYLHSKGYSYEEIGRNVHCSRALVQNWITYHRLSKGKEVKALAAKLQTKPKADEVKLPEPQLVETGTITMIRAPKRSILERIKDFFA